MSAKKNVAKTFNEILAIIDGLNPKMPNLPVRFHVVEPAAGARLLLLQNRRREVSYVSDRALAGAIMRLCNNLPIQKYMLTFTQAREVAKMWIHAATPIAEPKSVAEKSDADLCFHRLPFDLPTQQFDTPPLFEEFLSRCSNNLALAAFIGSLFEPKADKQQYVWIHGSGQNGKGALGYLLRQLLGPAFHSEVIPSMKSGVDKFWTSSFIGKRLVLFPDCNSPQFPQSGLFKSLTGADYVRIERKGQDAYCCELNCKFMFFSNEELIISNTTADLRRAIYCHVDPIKGTADTSYYEALWSEAPRIFRECIDTYRNLCPSHGTIPVDDSNEQLAVLHDAKYSVFFEKYFTQVEDKHLPREQRQYVSPADMQRAFVDAGIRNPREQNKYIDHFSRMYGVEKIDLKNLEIEPRRRYVGLKRNCTFIKLASYDNAGLDEPREVWEAPHA